MTTWIQTYSGRKFTPLEPRREDVAIEDIAHALSLVCRFTGHVQSHYSVAQHSVLVSYTCDPKDALWGLLHDASEAYIADVASPIKHSPEFTAYRAAEARLQCVICARFGLPAKMPGSVKRADLQLLATEARDLMPPPLLDGWQDLPEPLVERIEPWSPQYAEEVFLGRFGELRRERIAAAVEELR